MGRFNYKGHTFQYEDGLVDTDYGPENRVVITGDNREWCWQECASTRTIIEWWKATDGESVDDIRCGTKVRIDGGRIGSHHDPYGWNRITVERLGRTVEFMSCGLRGVQCTCNGHVIVPFARTHHDDKYQDEAEGVFETLTGLNPAAAEYYYYTRIYVEDPMGCLVDYE